jgi:hypothetical protein
VVADEVAKRRRRAVDRVADQLHGITSTWGGRGRPRGCPQHRRGSRACQAVTRRE